MLVNIAFTPGAYQIEELWCSAGVREPGDGDIASYVILQRLGSPYSSRFLVARWSSPFEDARVSSSGQSCASLSSQVLYGFMMKSIFIRVF